MNEKIDRAKGMRLLLEDPAFLYLMKQMDRKGQELLNALLDATDNPEIPTDERLPYVFQLACNLKANRELNTAVNQILYEGEEAEKKENKQA